MNTFVYSSPPATGLPATGWGLKERAGKRETLYRRPTRIVQEVLKEIKKSIVAGKNPRQGDGIEVGPPLGVTTIKHFEHKVDDKKFTGCDESRD